MSSQSSRSYLAIASAIVIAGVLISASLFVVIGEARITTTETSISTTTTTLSVTTSNPPINCNVITGPGSYATPTNSSGLPLVVGNNLYQCERVLVISPGSTGMLVVSYQTDLDAVSPPSAGGSEIANLTADVLAPVYSRAVTIPQQILGYTNATGVTITPSIASVNVTALGNLKSFTVTYTISVSSGVSGSFELQYLDACPTMVPLLVGYTASQLNASSFPDYSPFLQGCTWLGMLPGGILESVSGIQMAWMIQTVQSQQNVTST